MPDVYVNADTGEPINFNQMPTGASYPPTSMQQKNDKADLLDKIKPDAIAEVIRHKLLGERQDTKTLQWVKMLALQELALSEVGAEQISNLILGVANQNSSISNLKDEEIKRRVLSIAETAQIMCLENWQEYGIKRKAQLYFVHEVVFTIALVTLKQPENEGIRKMITGTHSVNEVRNLQEQKNDGWSIFGRGRK